MTCSICLDDFGNKEIIKHHAYGIEHTFHKSCIQTLVKHSFNCPLRCGHKYSVIDFLTLQDRIKGASKIALLGMLIGAGDLNQKTLLIHSKVRLHAILISMVMRANRIQDALPAAISTLYLLEAIRCASKSKQDVINDNPDLIELTANYAGITADEVAASVIIGSASAYATAAMLSIRGSGYIKKIGFSLLVGSAVTGISVASKIFFYKLGNE